MIVGIKLSCKKSKFLEQIPDDFFGQFSLLHVAFNSADEELGLVTMLRVYSPQCMPGFEGTRNLLVVYRILSGRTLTTGF